MSVISRYLLKEFFRVLAFALLTCLLIFLLVDFLEKIDNFMEAGIPLRTVAQYYLAVVPSVIFNMAPVAVLLATLISLGILARNSEIVAFKAGGVSLGRLSQPILLSSILISVLMFMLSDTVIPRTSTRVNHIWEVQVEKRRDAASPVQENVWFRSSDGIYNFGLYNRKTRSIGQAHIYRLSQNFRLVDRIEARTAAWKNGRWEFRDGLEKKYRPNGDFTVRRFKVESVRLANLPDSFAQVEQASDEMSLSKLLAWIRRMKAEGYDPLKYQVDLQLKIAFPFICTIMALIGLPIAFWREKGGGIALGIGAGIGLSFMYLVLLGLSRALGYSGLLPPVVAAWLPNTLFILLGLSLFSFVRQ